MRYGGMNLERRHKEKEIREREEKGEKKEVKEREIEGCEGYNYP